MLTFIIFFVTLIILVLVHELGHFIAAKIIGVQVKSFAFGFPPTIFSKKVGDTEYKFNAVPLGGYVSLRGEGEENESAEELKNPKNLQARTAFEQFLILAAGVFMNYLLAVFILWLVYLIGFVPIYSDMWKHNGLDNSLKAVVTVVEKDSPADKEGIQQNDVITKVDGQRVYLSDEVVGIIRNKSDQNGAKVDVEINRNGQNINKTIQTYKSKVEGQKNQVVEITRIGVVMETQGKLRGNIISSLGAAFSETFRIVKLTFVGIVSLFKLIITKFTISEDVSGPVGIYAAAGVFVGLGFTAYLQFIAIISLSLAVFNILPIPALDGGHIFITLIESIFRKKFSMKTKSIIQLVGFSAIILLFIFVTFKDIMNLGLLNNLFKR